MYLELAMPICAIIFSLLLCIVYFFKQRVKLIENNMYSLMLISVLVDSILVTVAKFLVIGKNISDLSSTITFIIGLLNKIDACLLIIITSCIFLYVMVITFEISEEKFKKLLRPTIASNIVLFGLVFVLEAHLIQAGEIISISGTFLYPTYLGCALFVFTSGLITLLNINNITKKHIPLICTIFIFFVLMTIFVFNPYMTIISIALTFINFIMYFTIENPDVNMIEQLENAKDQADKANRAKTDFLSSMSHEIRTPLNAIVGFSDCINHTNNIEEAKENAKDIINASNTLLEIVNGILDISKIEAGKLEIVNSAYNAPKIFEEVAKLITPKMNEKGLDFSYKIANDLPRTLYGDHTNIKKIITNLLSNACKYTDKGFVRYTVNCVTTGDICKIIISVEDSGRGIKKENVDKLFTKFQRLDEDRNTTIEGTGLGLAITKQLAELMGGKVIVHTVYGEGSKFTVVLTQRVEKVQIKEEIVNDIKSIDFKDIKILVVDDNELNLKVVTKLLSRFNINNVTCVESGFICLDKVNNGEKYDVILMDDMMPKMSGVETLKRLRENSIFNTPVVALTANAITGMREKYLLEGFYDYLAKPIEREELIRVLSSLSNRNDNNKISSIVSRFEVLQDIKEEKYDKEYLRKNGINLDKSLSLLGDMEMYNETLKDFVDSIDDKFERIKSYKKSLDMENYAIEVHSLKSDSKYLGFTKLAEIAYEHELKSKDKDISFIRNHFDDLEDELERILVVLKNYLSN